MTEAWENSKIAVVSLQFSVVCKIQIMMTWDNEEVMGYGQELRPCIETVLRPCAG